MADSLRDQLLKSGIVTQVQQERAREPRRPPPPPSGKRPVRSGSQPQAHASRPSDQKATGQSQQDIDLARAYALRAKTEQRERKQIEQEAAEQARLKRERKLQIQQLLEGKSLNKADADQPRNFEYGGKIRRIHVDDAQLAALNGGELGVVQQAGRYLLVTRDVAEQVRGIDPRQLALLVDPGASGIGDDGVPDDLMW